MKKYGLPYMGSKSRIAEWVIDTLPPGEVLVDLFAGGCAVTHCALLSKKWEGGVIANDLQSAPALFADAVAGKFANETRWISREDFFALKDSEPYVRWCWSFGNNGRTYIYGTEIEPLKRAAHYAIVFDQWDELARLAPDEWEKCRADCQGIVNLRDRRRAFRRVCQIQSLQRLERLQRLQSLQSLTIKQLDYRAVEIPDGATVYCDIPYQTAEKRFYGVDFDRRAFCDWALSRDFPVFVSEYAMPEGFTCIAQTRHICTMNNAKVNHVVERIFVQKQFENQFKTELF